MISSSHPSSFLMSGTEYEGTDGKLTQGVLLERHILFCCRLRADKNSLPRTVLVPLGSL